MIKHSVFIGGTEVNDELLTLTEANKLALQYIDDGYDPKEIYISYYVVNEKGDMQE